MSSSRFQIVLDQVEAIPISLGFYQKYLCKRLGKSAFLVGNNYRLSFNITNIGRQLSPKGQLIISVIWANSQTVNMKFDIPTLNSGESRSFTSEPTGILTPWFGLFYANFYLTSIITHPIYRNKNEKIDPKTAFFSIFAQEIEEFHQFWAMIASVVALWLIVVKDYIFPFLRWFSYFLPN